jgi:nucleoside-diphosphate-sugar epimerase
VGTKLAAHLLKQGHHVIGADLRPCGELEGRGGYRFQTLDLTDPASVNALDFAGLDNVIHLAAAGVKAAGRSWPLCTRVNIEGTANLVGKLIVDSCQLAGREFIVDSCQGAGREFIVDSCKLAVDRENQQLSTNNCQLTTNNCQLTTNNSPLSTNNSQLSTTKKAPLFLYTQTWYEEHITACPAFADNPYVATKHAASRWIETLASVYPAPVVIAKVFQVYGPGDDPNNVLSYAARCLKHGEPATFGSGTQLRDWIYIDDFINALAACLNTSTPGLTRYDLGTGQTHSLREMIEQLVSITASSSKSSEPASAYPISSEPASAYPISSEPASDYPLSSSPTPNSHLLTPRSSAALSFDPSRDRGDIHITDHARTPPPSWFPSVTSSAGLSQLLSSIS